MVLLIGVMAASTWFVARNDLIGKAFNEGSPDTPVIFGKLDKHADMETYLRARNEFLDDLRGFDTAKQDSREKAVREMEQSELALANRLNSQGRPAEAAWKALGPAPIPVSASTSYSGRVSAIAVHPTNPDIVYVGTAQGGLYRSMDGGANWIPLMDDALTLAIGAVAISPSDPTTIFVGTGESTLCGSGCFIGVGLYRITNADTTPVVSGPLNKNASNADVFTGRAISEVIVHPTDPNTVFVSTTSGIAGIGASVTGLTLPTRGVYRSTNAMAANPTFTLLPLGALSERSVTDMVIEPGNPAHLYVGVLGVSAGDGGVYYSANALDASPTFNSLLLTALTGNNSRVELAANKVGAVTTVYAASGDGTGSLYKSVDAAPFTLVIDNNFCNPQCFYDIAVAVDPTDANKVFLGGSPTLAFGKSINGGTSFTSSSSGLHVDTQAFGVAPSNPNVVYFGSDGGIWRTTNVSATPIVWTTLNNTSMFATQFMGLAIHPTDRNYSLGGTQDNGTQFLAPDGVEWVRSDGGDGGFAVIDQTSPNTTNVTAYHTYYNSSGSQIGFTRATTTVPPGDPNWGTFFGCGGTANGINCADTVHFYAPMVGGPNAPGSTGNTLYFGTNRLYRSINQGTTMTDVSGTLPERVSAIAIAPQDDAIRLVGLRTGAVYLSTTIDATTMTNVTGSIPARYVGRIAIDPTNSNIAYVGLNGFGLAAGQHVWKTTNLLSGSPTWTAAGSGIPDVPVNTLAIDPAAPQIVYAGTDIGVFKSTDGGTTWTPFSNGLPRVAVFGMEIQKVHRVLRIATHGRGMYDIDIAAPRKAQADFDGDGKSDLSVFRESNGVWFRQTSSDGAFRADQFGAVGDKITPGDYDGDGKTDFAVFRPSTGVWYVMASTAGLSVVQFGLPTDLPVQADYDNDGKTDIAIYRPSTGQWWLRRSTAGVTVIQFGLIGDKPVQGDYDADGTADIAVFRPSNGVWFIQRSTAGLFVTQYGVTGDKVVPADYDGDGKTDIAVYRDSAGVWYITRSTGGEVILQFGLSSDVPTPGDFDGDGKADIGVFRPSNGVWYRINSSNSSSTIIQYGVNGDKPVPSGYVPQQ